MKLALEGHAEKLHSAYLTLGLYDELYAMDQYE
jgi:hypothetical protein